MLAIAMFADIECANATSVVACDPVSLAPADKVQVEGLAKHLVAPRLLDQSRSVLCKHDAVTVALFQTVPTLAADGALETDFTTCHRHQRWECELSRERAIDVVEAARSETIRIATRDDLSADKLRELYAAALKLAGNDSTTESPGCPAGADQAQRLRTLFVRGHSKAIKVSRDGALFNVERDHIEIKLSIEADANGVRTTKFHCITQWSAGDRGL